MNRLSENVVAWKTFDPSDLRNKDGKKEYTTPELRQMAMDYLLEKEGAAQQWRRVFFFVFVMVCVFGCATGVSVASMYSLQQYRVHGTQGEQARSALTFYNMRYKYNLFLGLESMNEGIVFKICDIYFAQTYRHRLWYATRS